MIIITNTGSERVHITAPTERPSTGEVLLRLVNSATRQAVEVTLDVQGDTGYCIEGHITLDALTGGQYTYLLTDTVGTLGKGLAQVGLRRPQAVVYQAPVNTKVYER